MAKLEEMQQAIQKTNNNLTTGQSLSDLCKRIDVVKRFEEILGKKTPGFVGSLLSLYNASAQLKACDPKSILSSAMIAATLDLPINPTLGFAAIVPYGKNAQFQIMSKGLVQLAIRTGVYQTINAAEIYEGEIIEHNRITGNFVIDESQKKSDKVVGYVAYFRLLSGFEKYLYMSVEQVRAHAKKFSKSYANPNAPWSSNFEAMAIKTVQKLLLSKYGILSVEMKRQGETIQEDRLQKAIEYDQAVVTEAVDGEKVTYPDNPESDAIEPGNSPTDINK